MMRTIRQKRIRWTGGSLALIAVLSACGSGGTAGQSGSTQGANQTLLLGSANASENQSEGHTASDSIDTASNLQSQQLIDSNNNSSDSNATETDFNNASMPESIPETTPEIVPESIPETNTGMEILAELSEEPSNNTPPANVACSASPNDVQQSVLFLVNEARASEQRCGTKTFSAAPALTLDSKLQAAATIHSTDMADHNFFSHTGSDGSSAALRADQQRYSWRMIGENIAAGQQTAEDVVNAWMDSAGHCENIMNPNFENMAVSCVENDNSEYVKYWTQMFGTTF